MNTETQLYLALKSLLNSEGTTMDTGIGTMESDELVEARHQARKALEQFELELGPLPDWAVSHNLTDELVPGLQLFTKDGRHCGNAHIIRIEETPSSPHYTHIYHLLTDAGNSMQFSQAEVENQFWLGKFISVPAAVVARFGRIEEEQEHY